LYRRVRKYSGSFCFGAPPTARALLGWSQQRLADKAIVSLNAVTRLERREVDARMSTLTALERALTKAGVEFIPTDQKGEGVRLRDPKA
jgi:transcriptional regulator with XRE-family HTH domain